jgi:hypothetical protein
MATKTPPVQTVRHAIGELNVHQRVAEAMKNVTYIQKDRKPGMRYTITSHDVVTSKVRPELLKHGVIYYPVDMEWGQDGNRTHVQLNVRFVNIDNPEDFFDVTSLGYGVDQQDKGPGKAISYAVKYGVLKGMGLETGDDPDNTQDTSADHVSGAIEAVQTWAKSVKAELDACKTVTEVETVRANEDGNIKTNWSIDKATVQTLGTQFDQAKLRCGALADA